MGKVVRKNAKWHLLDDPGGLHLDPAIPSRARALRSRNCHLCGDEIVAGEEHLAKWFKTNAFYPMRYNMCCFCGLEILNEEYERSMAIPVFLKEQIKSVSKYIKYQKLDIKRMIKRDL